MLKAFPLRWLTMLIAGWLVPAAIAAAQSPSGQLPSVELYAGMYRIQAELAHTHQDRQVGLMYRETLPENHGMLFAYAEAARRCMWMRNTLIPLSVAFMDGDGRVLNIEDMTPQTDDTHCSANQAKFALEMNQGWFAKRGIAAGHVIRGTERLPPAH